MIDKYKTIASPSQGYFMDRSSKFYSFAYPVETEQQVKDILKHLHKQYHDARHIVYAYVLGEDGSNARASDAGEPSGSSGPPVLRTIQSLGLTNIMVAVVRYFGGKKLGIPGLINAYSTAARDALENAQIVEKIITEDYKIRCEYNQVSIIMNAVEKAGGKIKEQNYTTDCQMVVSVPVSQSHSFEKRLGQLRIDFNKLQ